MTAMPQSTAVSAMSAVSQLNLDEQTSAETTRRSSVACYLHDKHARTLEAVQAEAMPTPDSLGAAALNQMPSTCASCGAAESE
jgi:hypothetical protein